MNLRTAASIVTISVLLGCTTREPERAHEVSFAFGGPIDPAAHGDTFEWQSKGPTDFLEFLSSRDGYTVWGVHKGWIRAQDIPDLIRLIDSQEPCGDVKMSISSHIHWGHSTVGREAAFLIQGFRKGEYPPELNSIRFDYSAEEIREWWAEYDPDKAT
jgi:hypothetical protein